MNKRVTIGFALALTLSFATAGVFAGPVMLAGNNIPGDHCNQLPDHNELREALASALDADNAGLDLNVWGVIVNRDGEVCTVAFTGNNRGDQWPASRLIAAQKAYTANSFSLPGLALSTANLFTVAQPGGSAYGLEDGNPVDTGRAYRGNPKNYGQANDPIVGHRIGGTSVIGGGLSLYNQAGELLGAVGVSGDTSCADHFIAWRTRHGLELDFVPTDDNAIFDITEDENGHPVSASGFGHPHCLDEVVEQSVLESLPATP